MCIAAAGPPKFIIYDMQRILEESLFNGLFPYVKNAMILGIKSCHALRRQGHGPFILFFCPLRTAAPDEDSYVWRQIIMSMSRSDCIMRCVYCYPRASIIRYVFSRIVAYP